MFRVISLLSVTDWVRDCIQIIKLAFETGNDRRSQALALETNQHSFLAGGSRSKPRRGCGHGEGCVHLGRKQLRSTRSRSRGIRCEAPIGWCTQGKVHYQVSSSSAQAETSSLLRPICCDFAFLSLSCIVIYEVEASVTALTSQGNGVACPPKTFERLGLAAQSWTFLGKNLVSWPWWWIKIWQIVCSSR